VLRDWWEKVSRVDASSNAGFFVAVLMACGLIVAVAAIMALLGGGLVPLAIAAVFVPALLFLALLHATALERGSRLMIAKGSSTPYTPQHSNLQALVAKGAYAEAAEAYREVIASQPQDLLACEQLVQLALRELKDYPLALFAVREAERRAPDARRGAGYALLAANIYRDNLKDYGRTMVELRRILARYPDVPNAAALRAEIEELKALHFEAR
jgi:tetratricopeptide (TPR) repeat protein